MTSSSAQEPPLPCCRQTFLINQPLLHLSSKTLQYLNYQIPFTPSQQHYIKKHICAFLNTEGGCLLFVNANSHEGKSYLKSSYYTQQVKKFTLEYFRLLAEMIKPDFKEVAERLKIEFVPLQTTQAWIEGGYALRVKVLKGNRRNIYFFSEKSVDFYNIRRKHESISISTKDAFEVLKNRLENPPTESKIQTHIELCNKPALVGHPVNSINEKLKQWVPHKVDKKQTPHLHQAQNHNQQHPPLSFNKVLSQKSKSQQRLHYENNEMNPSSHNIMQTQKIPSQKQKFQEEQQGKILHQSHKTKSREQPILYFILINFTQSDIDALVAHQPNYGFEFVEKQSIILIFFQQRNYQKFIEKIEVIKKYNTSLLVLEVTNKLSFEALDISNQVLEEFFILFMRGHNQKGFSLHNNKQVYLPNKKITARAFLMLSDNGIRPRFKS